MSSICPFCTSTEYELQYATYDTLDNQYEIVRCLKCATYYLIPNPTEHVLEAAYDQSYYGDIDSGKKFQGVFNIILDFFRLQQAQKVSRLVGSSGNVLDIGCGGGSFLKHLSTCGNYDLHGLEREAEVTQSINEVSVIKIHSGELDECGLTAGYFDAITLFHVFEHLSSPSEYLQSISQLLNPRGYLVISFPNIDSWQAGVFKGHWLHLDPPRHLFFIKPSDFKIRMADCGFSLVHENYYSFEQNPFGAMQSALNLLHSKRDLLFEHIKGNIDYINANTHPYIMTLEKLALAICSPFLMLETLVSGLFKKGATVDFVFKKEA